MKIKTIFKYAVFCLSAVALTKGEYSHAFITSDTFGIYDNNILKTSELTLQEKSSLINAQKQLYNTAQRILENHYLAAWFKNYAKQNKLPTIEEAKKEYYEKTTPVSDAEVAKFIKENTSNKELYQIPESQRPIIVKKYLKKVAQARIEQTILAEGYKQDKIRLVAYEKPQEQVVQFEKVGHIYDPELKNAKVTIVEFADYQCPFCVKANAEIMKVVTEYKGKVQYIFMDFPLLDKHPQALPAALAAKCAANQNKYWEMHNLIFNRAPMAELTSAMYTSFAQNLNLNLTQFKECQNDPSQKEPIELDINEGLRVGVNETPTLYVNGQKFDDYISAENLKIAVKKILEQ